MMTFACITPDGRPIRIDNEHADGAGMPANTGNWMVQYTDNFTFINAGTKPRSFRIYKKGAVSGALAVAIRDETGKVLDAMLKCHPYVYAKDNIPPYADRSLLTEKNGEYWYVLNGRPYWEQVDERALVCTLEVAPGQAERISVDYLILGHSNGGIRHWVTVE